MTGLEKILSQIAEGADASAQHELEVAQTEVDQLMGAAKQKADKLTVEILAKAKVEADDLKERAHSSAQLERRNQLLKFKQEYIEGVIDETKTSLASLADDEYFSVLLKLAGSHAQEGPAKMQLSKKDLTRLPSDFEKKVSDAVGFAVTIDKEPADIDAGFLLIYEGIDINCSFDAIFEDAIDNLRDVAGSILFSSQTNEA